MLTQSPAGFLTSARFLTNALQPPRVVANDRRPRPACEAIERSDKPARQYRNGDIVADNIVKIAPLDLVQRRALHWSGMAGEVAHSTSLGRIESHFCAPVNLLIAHERGARQEGETFVEGLPRSALRDLAGRLTLVPAGHQYHDWQEPRVPSRVLFFYFELPESPFHSEHEARASGIRPRLFFRSVPDH